MRLSIIRVLFFLLPLIYIPNIFNPYEFPKFVVFVGTVGFLGIATLRQAQGKLLRNDKNKLDLLTCLVIFYGIIVYLADILGLDPRTSFLGSQFRHQGFVTLLAGICLFLLIRYNFHKDHNNYKDYTRWILLGGFLVCIIAIWQGIGVFIFHDLTIPTYQGRIVGTIGNPNSLGGYLAMVLPFLLFAKNKNYKHFVLSGVIIFVVFMAQSRGAILASGLVIALYVMKLLYKAVFWKKIAAIIVGFVLIIFILKTYQSGIVKISRESIWDNRVLIWTEGLKAFQRRPILGYGQENFELIFPKERKMFVDNAHNIFLETLISSGVIGFVFYLWILICAFKKASIDIRMSFLAFIIVGQFNPLSITQISLFWFLLGISSKKSPAL